MKPVRLAGVLPDDAEEAAIIFKFLMGLVP